MYCFIMCIPLAPKNTYFQRASLREVRRSETLKEMTLPADLRLALHENIPTKTGILERERYILMTQCKKNETLRK